MYKKLFLSTIFACYSISIFAQSSSPGTTNTVISNGIGLGSAIAVTISWSQNKSILWAIIHGLFGWFYVVYFYFQRDKK